MARKMIILGIGGTGTKIVREIRQMWVDDAGLLPSNVALGAIDAQAAGPEGGYIPGMAYTPPSPRMMAESFDEYSREKDVNGVGWLDWWPEQITDKSHDFSDGCGAVRPNGQFFAFYYADKIVETVTSMMSELAMRSPEDSADVSFEVYLVGSAGNGTGGGTHMAVASIVRDTIGAGDGAYSAPAVVGVFIPGAVTKHGMKGTRMLHEVGASGYATLIEHQYEFNRNNPDAPKGFKPREPHVFKGLLDGGLHTFKAAAGISNRDEAFLTTPLDFFFVLETQNTKGQRTTYKDLISTAAQTLALMLGGADVDNRMLDLKKRCSGGRRFGSMGAIRVCTPMEQLIDFAIGRQGLNALTVGAGADENRWSHVLRDSSISAAGNDERLIEADADLVKSVDFFIDHVLEMKEKEADDLVGRFKAEDESLLAKAAETVEGLDDIDDIETMMARAEALESFVATHLARLKKKRTATLITDAGSVWSLLPSESDRRDEDEPLSRTNLKNTTCAGTKWHIDQRAMEFVNAGAFGMLQAWLAKLGEELEANRLDAQETLKKEFASGQPDADLAAGLNELREQSDSIFVKFKKGDFRDEVSAFASDADDYLGFLLWQSKFGAIDKLYEKTINYVRELTDGAAKAASRQQSSQVVKGFEELSTEAVQEIDRNIQNQSGGTDIGTKFFIGGDKDMRQNLLTDLEKDERTRTVTLLQGEYEDKKEKRAIAMTPHNQGLFKVSLAHDTSRSLIGLSGELRDYDDLDDRLESYAEDLKKVVGDSLKATVRKRCGIEPTLVREREMELLTWYEMRHEAPDDFEQQEVNRVEAALSARVTSSVWNSIQNMDWDRFVPSERKEEKTASGELWRGAVDHCIAGRLLNFISFVSPQWKPKRGKKFQDNRQWASFLNFTEDSDRLKGAMEIVANFTESRREPKSQDIPGYPSDKLDIVTLEVGCSLDMLTQSTTEMRHYKMARGMNDSSMSKQIEKEFTPHRDKASEKVGDAWLEYVQQEQEDSGAVLSYGEVLFALGRVNTEGEYLIPGHPNLFGHIQKSGNKYKLAKSLQATDFKTEDGKLPFESSYDAGDMLGTGFGNVIETMDDARRPENIDRQRALRVAMMKDLHDLSWGREPLGIGPEGTAEFLNNLAGDYDRASKSERRQEEQAMQQKTADDLRKMAKEVIEFDGKRTTLLSIGG